MSEEGEETLRSWPTVGPGAKQREETNVSRQTRALGGERRAASGCGSGSARPLDNTVRRQRQEKNRRR